MKLINRYTRQIRLLFLTSLCLSSMMLFTSCKKLVDIGPSLNALVENNVFAADATAIAVLTDIYANMSRSGTGSFTGSRSISVLAGLSADELTLGKDITNLVYQAYYKNELSSQNPSAGSEFWEPLYKYIYKCNAAIEGLSTSEASSLTNAVRQQLLGEAYFLRAFFYFYLVNMYGDVPLALTTDYKLNGLLPRTSVSLVYNQIIKDLKQAEQLLSAEFLDNTLLKGTSEKVRPTKWVANALLSRTYLYIGKFEEAEIEATKVINQSSLFATSNVKLNDVFLKNSKETIWQLQPIVSYYNTQDGLTFVIPTTGLTIGNAGIPQNPVQLSSLLLNVFENGDLRKVYGNWVDTTIISGISYPFIYKYKQNSRDLNITSNGSMKEYLMVFRLAEQYLIRAEARANKGDISGAKSDIDIIRVRAGLANTLASDKDGLLSAIAHERQVELACEWGHRWFDLKRTGRANTEMVNIASIKGGIWQPTDLLYPILRADILKNPNLTQNPGYE